MTECDYCDAEFDDEDDLLDHLAEEHEGELGRIDRRRVEDRTGEGGGVLSTPVIVGLALGVIVVAALGTTFLFGGGGGGSGPLQGDTSANPEGIEAQALPDAGDQALLANVQTHASEGSNHVPSDTEIDYEFPPTSGTHYGAGTAGPGFYEKRPQMGYLLHSLEHGAVIVYYDPAALDQEARRSLREFGAANTRTWASFIAVPTPQENPESAFVLTAWGYSLRMDDYDPETVKAFLAEYVGRGPENPIR